MMHDSMRHAPATDASSTLCIKRFSNTAASTTQTASQWQLDSVAPHKIQHSQYTSCPAPARKHPSLPRNCCPAIHMPSATKPQLKSIAMKAAQLTRFSVVSIPNSPRAILSPNTKTSASVSPFPTTSIFKQSGPNNIPPETTCAILCILRSKSQPARMPVETASNTPKTTATSYSNNFHPASFSPWALLLRCSQLRHRPNAARTSSPCACVLSLRPGCKGLQHAKRTNAGPTALQWHEVWRQEANRVGEGEEEQLLHDFLSALNMKAFSVDV